MKVTIGYAYPSSITATALGKKNEGTFYACKVNAHGSEIAGSMEPFATWQDAKDWAEATGLPFDSSSLPDPKPSAREGA